MKIINKKKQLIKNSLFNTLNLNHKKILKIRRSQHYIKKEYGNFYSGSYICIYNELFEKSIKKYYQGRSAKEINSKDKNITISFVIYKIFRILPYYLKLLIKKIILTKKIVLFFTRKRSYKIKQKKIIFLGSFDYSNQMSFVPITKKLKNKDYYVLIKTSDQKKINFFKELYGNDNIINLNECGTIKDIINTCLFIINDLSKILTFKKIFNNKDKSITKFLFIIFKNYYEYLIYSKIIQQINPKKSMIMSSIGNEMFIAALRNFSKASLYGYAVQGISYSGQSLTSQFLFNSVDKLFCYGNSDYEHFKNIAKSKMFVLPKKIIISGSVRDYYHAKKNFSFKKINKKIKILYLRSNHIWFGNMDDSYLEKFSKIIKSNFEKKIIYTIKERKNTHTTSSKNLITKNIIKKSKILINKKVLTEKLISESDIIVGTISTSILYQSLYFDKLIIQLGAKKFSWANNLSKCGILCAENESQIFQILSNLFVKKNFYKNQLKQQNLLSKHLITKKNSIDFILNELKKN